MAIKTIQIENIRVIENSTVTLSSGFNVFVGSNAAGKTSILEACTVLATGKSFRTVYVEELIQHNHDYFRIIATLTKSHIGIERRNKKTQIHINQQINKKNHQLSEHVVSLVITPKIADLIESSATVRRRFIDWGLFHVEQSSKKILQAFQKTLQHRNALLKKNGVHKEEIAIWDQQLASTGEALHKLRENYCNRVMEHFNQNYRHFLNIVNFSMRYKQGWSQNKSLLEVLKEKSTYDMKIKNTSFGPHRADFLIYIGEHPAKKILSRGQLKLLSFLLRLSQIALFIQQTKKKPILLIDDLASELDQKNRALILSCLADLELQVLCTALEHKQLPLAEMNAKVFHVKQGVITEQSKDLSQ